MDTSRSRVFASNPLPVESKWIALVWSGGRLARGRYRGLGHLAAANDSANPLARGATRQPPFPQAPPPPQNPTTWARPELVPRNPVASKKCGSAGQRSRDPDATFATRLTRKRYPPKLGRLGLADVSHNTESCCHSPAAAVSCLACLKRKIAHQGWLLQCAKHRDSSKNHTTKRASHSATVSGHFQHRGPRRRNRSTWEVVPSTPSAFLRFQSSGASLRQEHTKTQKEKLRGLR